MDERDQARLELLDRIAERLPGLDLDRFEVCWRTLPDGGEALHVGPGGDFLVNCGEDLYVYGSLGPLIPGALGVIVIRPDRSRYLVRVAPDPAFEPD